MRQEFVSQIKDYLRNTPNFENHLEELRLNALVSGATEAEFKTALKELRRELPKKPIAPMNPYMKKLLTLDVVMHVFFLVFAIAALSLISSYITTRNLHSAFSDASSDPRLSDAMKKGANAPFITRVYANTIKLDGSRVFSFPGNNITLQISGTPKREVFGFFPYWMLSNESQIPFTGLTTISLFGLEVDGSGGIVTNKQDGMLDEGWAMWQDPKLTDVLTKAKRQHIKTQLTIKAFNNDNIEHLVTSDDAQRNFIANAIHLVNSKALDGITLDFEYVGTPAPKITAGFTRLVTNLRAEMKRQIPNAQLSVATYVSAASTPGLFDIDLLADQVDDFVVMGYDFHTPSGQPGPIAPLGGPNGLIGYMQNYLEKVSPDKLILALAYYGYDWPTAADGKAGQGNGDMLSYAEIAATSLQYPISWDETAETPYYQYTDPQGQKRVVHFENTRSLGLKYDYINKKNLRGVGIWALGYDGLNNDLRALLFEKFAR